jgi:hypothetical protein
MAEFSKIERDSSEAPVENFHVAEAPEVVFDRGGPAWAAVLGGYVFLHCCLSIL